VSENVPGDSVAPVPPTATLATPEPPVSESVPLTVIVAADVDDPFEGDVIATAGFVVSRLIVCVFEDVPPPLVAVQVTAVVPSVFTVVVVVSVVHAAERAVTAESGSDTAKLTVTLPLLYQPFDPLGVVGVTVGVITGGVVSAAALTVNAKK
jgi:hypothetical protein